MSDRIKYIIQEIKLKFQQNKEEILALKHQNLTLSQELDLVLIDKDNALGLLVRKDEEIRILKSEMEKLSKELHQSMLETSNKEDAISELVKEIDDCISLLKR
jgi:hypothetical protein